MSTASLKIRSFVFEDDPAIRAVLGSMLQGRGHEAIVFNTPAKCSHWMSPECPAPDGSTCVDIIITDNQMPQVSGLDFVRNQKKRGCGCRHYAVLSGKWDAEDLERAHELECMVFQKPSELSKISKWLDIVEKQIDPDRKLCSWFMEGDGGSTK
jgi:CheY-like chemotaxis protein